MNFDSSPLDKYNDTDVSTYVGVGVGVGSINLCGALSDSTKSLHQNRMKDELCRKSRTTDT